MKPNKNSIKISGLRLNIPEYFVSTEPLNGAPSGAKAFAAQTRHAVCYTVSYPVKGEKLLPRDRETLLGGIRYYLSGKQGIIVVETGEDYVYSIVKSLQEGGGVQYTLTFQKFNARNCVELHAFFEEIGTTGLREGRIFEELAGGEYSGDEEALLKGWARDPYDESVKGEALMNMSEDEKYDTRYPDYPLSLARGFVRTLLR